MEPPNITISGISSGQVEIIFARNWSIEISERSCIFANGYSELREKQGRRDSISRVRLGRGSNVGGRGGGGCHIHESIGHMRLGRSGDAKTARRVVA